MANQRRETNRARSRGNGMAHREPTHREARYRGEGYRIDGHHGDRKGYSGSPAHITMTQGPGPVPGAGELEGIGGPGPGSAADSIETDPAENPIRPTPPATSPKGGRADESGEED